MDNFISLPPIVKLSERLRLNDFSLRSTIASVYVRSKIALFLLRLTSNEQTQF